MNELRRIDNNLRYYAEQKYKNYLSTQPGATHLVDFRPSNNTIVDSMSLYAIRDEELDRKIINEIKEYLINAKLLVNEVDRMKEYDDVIPLIDYLRNVEKWSWKAISNYLNYSEDTIKKKLYRYNKCTSLSRKKVV